MCYDYEIGNLFQGCVWPPRGVDWDRIEDFKVLDVRRAYEHRAADSVWAMRLFPLTSVRVVVGNLTNMVRMPEHNVLMLETERHR